MNSLVLVYYGRTRLAQISTIRSSKVKSISFHLGWYTLPVVSEILPGGRNVVGGGGGIGGANPDNPEVRAVSSSKYEYS